MQTIYSRGSLEITQQELLDLFWTLNVDGLYPKESFINDCQGYLNSTSPKTDVFYDLKSLIDDENKDEDNDTINNLLNKIPLFTEDEMCVVIKGFMDNYTKIYDGVEVLH
jgi:hypothetical protein